MNSKITFLFLGLLAMLAIGWLLSSQEDAATEDSSVAVHVSEPSVQAAPGLEARNVVAQREVVAEPAETMEAEVIAPQGSKEPQFGTIQGRIVDSYGRQVLDGRVLVSRKGQQLEAQDLHGDDRTFRFELEAPRQYGLAVDPESLPQGYAPPLLEQRGVHENSGPSDRTGVFLPAPHYVKVIPDQEQTVDLVVGMATQLSGQVVDALGASVPGVFVQAVRLDSYGGEIDDRVVTDGQGKFLFRDVFPGNYRIAVLVTTDQTPKGKSWNPPPPVDVLVLGGQPHDLGQLVVGAGIGRIDGRIVDQDGRGFPGLLILAYSNEPVGEGLQGHDFNSVLATTRTDGEGYYSLSGLELMAVRVSLTSRFKPGQALGEGHPAMWVPDLEVDLHREGPQVDVGTSVVEESRPFEIRGTLMCDAAWLAAGHHAKEVRIEISQAEGQALPEDVRRNPIRRARARIDEETNSFRYAAETPMTELVVRLSLRGFEPKEYRVTPQPLQQWNQQIRIPGDLEKSP
ncbi:MAG: carboxypeptidase regulatory-like domain-containing protein [Planctomycetota bacterium]